MGVEGSRYSDQVGTFAEELVVALSPIGDVSRHARMPYHTLPADILDDEEMLIEWARESADIALR
ncbi:MAG: hypothetical protein P1T08_10840 [Acidimicrobiia bacterium]|nr:hypothetical protein [Acidimicrobiia bacterium]